MKTLKRLSSILLAVLMVMAMAIPAFADDTSPYIITINGAQKDGTYSAYKVFDATINSSGGVSYTIPDGSIIESLTGFDTVFTVTGSGATKYVTQKNGVADETVIQWLKDHQTDLTAGEPVSVTNTEGATSIELDVSSAGYYFITSTVGTKSAVEVTSAKPTATINDKTESTPSIDPNEGKKINGELVNDMQVGESATFTVTFTATNNATDENGTVTPINSYTVIDTPDGFKIDEDSVSVTVNGKSYSISNKEITADVSSTTGVLTVTIPWDQTTYPSPSTVVVTYTATLTNKNVAAESSNKAQIKYNETALPNEPEIHTYNYQVEISKVDADNTETKLANAEFVLKNSDGKFYAVDATTGVVSWVDSVDNATTAITDTNGLASFTGLKSGEYTLVEIKAPDGYNLAADKEFTLNSIGDKLTDTSVLTHTEIVADKTGTTLPSTGGMGTTLFYVVGAVLVVGAGLILVTRRRMSR